MLSNCNARGLLRVPWTTRRSNQSILKKIHPEYSLQGPMLKAKPNTLATWCKDPIHWKTLRLGKTEGRRRGQQSMSWLSKLQQTVKDREAWHAAAHRVAQSLTWLSGWTITTWEMLNKSTNEALDCGLGARGEEPRKAKQGDPCLPHKACPSTIPVRAWLWGQLNFYWNSSGSISQDREATGSTPSRDARWRSDEESACQYRRLRRCGFNPWVGKIPWRWE